MKPAPFDYFRPGTLREALDLLDRMGDGAKVLAGGQSLVPMLNFRLARPGAVIDLGRLTELAFIDLRGADLAIGAMTRQADLEGSEAISAGCPLLLQAVRYVGHEATRSRGTVGGSVAHADPSAEIPAVLAALEGEVVLQSAAGRRVLPAESFFVSYLTTALEPNELLTEVRFPTADEDVRRGSAFVELARRHGDFAQAGVAAVADVDAGGRMLALSLGLAGVAAVPVRVGASDLVRGKRPTGDLLLQLSRMVMEACDPDSDIHASAAYRKRVVGVLAERAAAQAFSAATG